MSLSLLLVAHLTAVQTSLLPVHYYNHGMTLWREGKPGDALPYLMTAAVDPELSLYAKRQVATMGTFALPLLYRGLWHEDEVVRRESAVILGWIGDPAAVDPLLMRMEFPDAPLETEYALRKLGPLPGEKLIAWFEKQPLDNPALADHQARSVARLVAAFRLAVDPEVLLQRVASLEERFASELEREPRGHAASARLTLLLLLAERKVARAAEPLVRALTPEAAEANQAIAEALLTLGPSAREATERAFLDPGHRQERPLLAVLNALSSPSASEEALAGPASVLLHEIGSDTRALVEAASWVARLARTPHPLLLWFRHHPEPEVRRALAPLDLKAEAVRARGELKPFFLEKTHDENPEVAAAHLLVVSQFLPDPDVERRLEAIVNSRTVLSSLREAALDVLSRKGPGRLLVPVIRAPEDPLRPAAVASAARWPEPEVVAALLDLLRETEPGEAKRRAIHVIAGRWKRPEAEGPLLELLKSGDGLSVEAARGLAHLGAGARARPLFIEALAREGTSDPDEAGFVDFLFTGRPARWTAAPAGGGFAPLTLEATPPAGKLVVVLEERTDYRGWVKVEELWKTRRLFRLDEGRKELTLYDRSLYDAIQQGPALVWLERIARQSVLDAIDLSEANEQRVQVVSRLPHGRTLGWKDDRLIVATEDRFQALEPGSSIRLPGAEGEESEWGSASLVVFPLWDREQVRFEPNPPPAGWARDRTQPPP